MRNTYNLSELYDLKELSYNEKKSINGGITFWATMLVIGAAAAAATAIYEAGKAVGEFAYEITH